jgi:hypothetical protein
MAHRSVLAVVLVLTAGLFAATSPVITAQGRGGGPAPAGRFVDNGDETITDTMTGLMWEKKTSAVGSGTSTLDVRDVDNTYTWEYAMHDYLDRLNGRLVANAAEKPFSPYNDWRLPTLQELQTLLEPASPGRINPAFGANAAGHYWTSSRRLLGPSEVPWYISFANDIPVYVGQPFRLHVRAVRAAR